VENILVIEDDRDISRLLSTALAMEHYMPVVAYDGQSGLGEAKRLLPSLILLDLMLPTLDGWEVCRRLRADITTRHIPIIMVSARAEEEDRIHGLDLGADDYIAKPFSTRELMARIRAVFRRQQCMSQQNVSLLRIGDLEIDPERYTVTMSQHPVRLTTMEFILLQRLAQEPGRVFSRDQLLTFLWGEDCFVLEHNLDVHIHSIRRKIEADPARPRYIQTLRGIGYTLKYSTGRDT
jgi:two-component system alkaline phosphatase synthesis response regulator PhoP